MAPIDWIILIGYLAATLALGLWLARRNRGEDDYFVAGRSLSGWLAGASMAATTFSIDTPLYVAGIVGTRGLAANWEWWGFGLAHVAMAVVFAPLWRRSGVLTDAAFTELRYGGPAAAWLRGIKAFLLALPVNCIGIGYAFLAMRKVVEALGIVSNQPVAAAGGIPDTLLLLSIVAALVLAYTVAGGLWAVVITDFIQLLLALLGASAVAWAAVHAAGGMGSLLDQLSAIERPELLSLVPWRWGPDGFDWIGGAGISISTFLAYLTVQWWSFRRSDGGGEFIQRMLATKDEQQARLAGWVFLVVNYLVRSWLWVLVALAALVLLPDQSDWEMSYPALAVQLLPPVVLGLVVVSLVAAFMSTVSTSVNWGASYLTHDLYQRFLRPNASPRELLLVGQLMSVMLLVLGVATALISDSIGTVFRLVIAIGTGPGVVLVLRWFWWRINAWSEISAMVISFAVAVWFQFVHEAVGLTLPPPAAQLLLGVGLTTVVWFGVTMATRPTETAVLQSFYDRVRPFARGWRRVVETQAGEPGSATAALLAWMLGCAAVYAALFGTGMALYGRFGAAAVLGIGALAAAYGLFRILPRTA